jgi:hypothetical protein
LRFLKGCGSFDTLKSGIARLVGGAFYGVRLIKDKIGFSSEHKDKITLLSPHEITTKALMADRHGQSATVCYLRIEILHHPPTKNSTGSGQTAGRGLIFRRPPGASNTSSLDGNGPDFSAPTTPKTIIEYDLMKYSVLPKPLVVFQK